MAESTKRSNSEEAVPNKKGRCYSVERRSEIYEWYANGEVSSCIILSATMPSLKLELL